MKKRFISAIIMMAIFIPILLLGDVYYSVLGGILGIIALWEITHLEKDIPDYMRIITYFICLFLILYNYKVIDFNNIYNFPIVISTMLFYMFSIIINKDFKKYNYKEALWLLSITFLIGILFNYFIKTRLLGIYPVIYCFIISTMTDTFAYVGGSLFGKHKLIKEISPNKTMEGSIIGSFFGTLFGTIFYYFAIGKISILNLILLSFVLSLSGQIGDLFFSSIKRFYKVKDYSKMIPGHGGILDRLDSVLFVNLVFLLYISIV